MKRRDFIVGVGILTAAAGINQAAAKGGILTPPQTEGPFFPVGNILESDADMTKVAGGNGKAIGQEIVVVGRVLDVSGKPLPNAKIDVWQACHTGRYQHPGDPNTAVALDPKFQYYCALRTDKLGRYRFRTIKPGAYPATRSWMRPPHIHLKVSRSGYQDLTTQMYFDGDSLNRKDSILQAIPAAQRELVLVKFQPVKNTLTGHFDIFLGSSRQAMRHSTPFLP